MIVSLTSNYETAFRRSHPSRGILARIQHREDYISHVQAGTRLLEPNSEIAKTGMKWYKDVLRVSEGFWGMQCRKQSEEFGY